MTLPCPQYIVTLNSHCRSLFLSTLLYFAPLVPVTVSLHSMCLRPQYIWNGPVAHLLSGRRLCYSTTLHWSTPQFFDLHVRAAWERLEKVCTMLVILICMVLISCMALFLSVQTSTGMTESILGDITKQCILHRVVVAAAVLALSTTLPS